VWKRKKSSLFFAALFLITLALRLCHSGLLWADEDYHLAAAIQTLHGKLLYRDIWYDKPPLSALVYAAIGAPSGWLLRLFDAVYVLAVCVAIARLARALWGEREAYIAAAALAFFLSFDLPASIIPIAPDFFMMLPHILAVYCAWRARPFAAGVWCGVAFLFNTKAVFALAACSFLTWRALPLLAAGFVAPNLIALAGWRNYFDQVWRWGLAYAKSPIAEHPVLNALRRTLDWLGFHAALVIGAAYVAWKERNRATLFLAIWAALSLMAVLSGLRVFPRYFLQLLPVAVLAFSRGATVLFSPGSTGASHVGQAVSPANPRRRRAVALTAITLAALIPLIRFAPRYILLALHGPANWRDASLDLDSREAAAWLNQHKHAGDTLQVWGYRPDIYVYTRLPYASRFGDSQPLTGVPADRHLTDARPLVPAWAARNRQELITATPTFIVDGLGPMNPRLAITRYPDLSAWLAQYQPVHRTALAVIYEIRVPSAGPAASTLRTYGRRNRTSSD